MHKKIKIAEGSSSHSETSSAAKYRQKDLGDLSQEAVTRDKEINGEDPGFTAAVDHDIYYRSYDHYNYGTADANNAFGAVKIKGHHLTKGLGRLCQPYDWVTVHW